MCKNGRLYHAQRAHQTDAYNGQTLEGRTRLHVEIIQAVRKAVGDDFPVAIRFGACDYMEGGSIKQDVSEACRIFEKAGADLLDISGGFNGFTIKGNSKPGWFSDLSAIAKENVSIPVLVTGGIKTADDAEQILLNGAADLIGVGRAMLKNPDWAVEATV